MNQKLRQLTTGYTNADEYRDRNGKKRLSKRRKHGKKSSSVRRSVKKRSTKKISLSSKSKKSRSSKRKQPNTSTLLDSIQAIVKKSVKNKTIKPSVEIKTVVRRQSPASLPLPDAIIDTSIIIDEWNAMDCIDTIPLQLNVSKRDRRLPDEEEASPTKPASSQSESQMVTTESASNMTDAGVSPTIIGSSTPPLASIGIDSVSPIESICVGESVPKLIEPTSANVVGKTILHESYGTSSGKKQKKGSKSVGQPIQSLYDEYEHFIMSCVETENDDIGLSLSASPQLIPIESSVVDCVEKSQPKYDIVIEKSLAVIDEKDDVAPPIVGVVGKKNDSDSSEDSSSTSSSSSSSSSSTSSSTTVSSTGSSSKSTSSTASSFTVNRKPTKLISTIDDPMNVSESIIVAISPQKKKLKKKKQIQFSKDVPKCETLANIDDDKSASVIDDPVKWLDTDSMDYDSDNALITRVGQLTQYIKEKGRAKYEKTLRKRLTQKSKDDENTVATNVVSSSTIDGESKDLMCAELQRSDELKSGNVSTTVDYAAGPRQNRSISPCPVQSTTTTVSPISSRNFPANRRQPSLSPPPKRSLKDQHRRSHTPPTRSSSASRNEEAHSRKPSVASTKSTKHQASASSSKSGHRSSRDSFRDSRSPLYDERRVSPPRKRSQTRTPPSPTISNDSSKLSTDNDYEFYESRKTQHLPPPPPPPSQQQPTAASPLSQYVTYGLISPSAWTGNYNTVYAPSTEHHHDQQLSYMYDDNQYGNESDNFQIETMTNRIPVLGSQDVLASAYYFTQQQQQQSRTFSNLIEIHQSPASQQQPFVVQKGNVLEIVPNNDSQLNRSMDDEVTTTTTTSVSAEMESSTNDRMTATVATSGGCTADVEAAAKQHDDDMEGSAADGSVEKMQLSNISGKLNGVVLSRDEIERRQIQQDESLAKRKQERDKRRLERMLRKERMRQSIKHILETNSDLLCALEREADTWSQPPQLHNDDVSVYDPNATLGRSCMRGSRQLRYVLFIK